MFILTTLAVTGLAVAAWKELKKNRKKPLKTPKKPDYSETTKEITQKAHTT